MSIENIPAVEIDNIFVTDVLRMNEGEVFYPATMNDYSRGDKSAGVRMLRNRGFITKADGGSSIMSSWVRTDKSADEWDMIPPPRPYGKRGPNRRRFHSAAKNGTLRMSQDGNDWFSVSYEVSSPTLQEVDAFHFTSPQGGVESDPQNRENVYVLRVQDDSMSILTRWYVRIEETVTGENDND